MKKIVSYIINLAEEKKTTFFAIIVAICVIALIVGIYSQFFYKNSDVDPFMLGINIGSKKTSEEYAELKTNFLNLFTNELYINSESIRVDKIETSQSVVYSGYLIENEDEAYYSVDLTLPILNIDNETAKEINADIKSEFYDTATKIMRSSSSYNIYQVSYVAYVNENIVSIVIKENSKTGNEAETTKIKTYTYDISSNEEVSLSKLIELKETTEEEVQEDIDSSIETAYENAKAIANEYGSTVTRDPDDDMYEIENSDDYFLTDDGYVYIIYDYGEDSNTNEMDIIIF